MQRVYFKRTTFLLWKRKQEKLQEPAKANVPVSLTSPERIKLTMQSYWLENKGLKLELSKQQNEIKKCSVPTSESLNNDLVKMSYGTQNLNVNKVYDNSKLHFKVSLLITFC